MPFDNINSTFCLLLVNSALCTRTFSHPWSWSRIDHLILQVWEGDRKTNRHKDKKKKNSVSLIYFVCFCWLERKILLNNLCFSTLFLPDVALSFNFIILYYEILSEFLRLLKCSSLQMSPCLTLILSWYLKMFKSFFHIFCLRDVTSCETAKIWSRAVFGSNLH